MVGPFPPPVYGMALGNAAMRERLRRAGANVTSINLAAPTLDRRLGPRLQRLPRVILGLGRLLITPGINGTTLYMRLSGGAGQVYDLCFLLIARIRQMRTFLSHHSFAYLGSASKLTRMVVSAAGGSATHVTLSENMGKQLRQLYPGVGRTLAISNAALFFVASGAAVREHTSLSTIGFLSNVSEEKGVLTFLEIAAELEKCGLPLVTKLAGAYQDARAEQQVRRRLAQLHNLEYVGAKYGADKWAFLDTIDVLLFPTVYANEAEPVTIHEAMMCGIPVIANRCGCIGDVLGDDVGLVVDRPEGFVVEAVRQIETWLAFPEMFKQASRAARARYLALRSESTGRLESLLHEICNSDSPHVPPDKVTKSI